MLFCGIRFAHLQYLPGYPGAGFGIGEGVVVVLHAEAAGLGDGLELVVGQAGELAARGAKGVVEIIVGIVHPIHAKDGLEAAFVEGLVMRYKIIRSIRSIRCFLFLFSVIVVPHAIYYSC